MNKFNIIFLSTVLFVSCSTAKIKVENDYYKKEKKVFLIQDKEAKKDLDKWIKERVSTQLVWIKNEQTPENILLKISFNTPVLSNVSDVFYLKLDNQVYKLYPENLKKITLSEYNNTVTSEIIKKKKEENETEKKEEKENDVKENDEIVKVTNSVSNYNFDKYKMELFLEKPLISKLKSAKNINLHFYINDFGYTIRFNAYDRNKIRKFLKK